MNATVEAPTPLEQGAMRLLRGALVAIFLIFGAQKFTLVEAQGIAPLVTHSPLTSWLNVLGTQGASRVVGTSELIFGIMLAIGFRQPGSLVAVLGGAGAVVCFLTTLSFLLTTPGVFATGHAPVMSADGLFLLKDIVLLAASGVLLAQSLAARQRLQR